MRVARRYGRAVWIVCALVAVVSLAVAGYAFSHLGDTQADTPQSTWVVIGFVALFVAAGFLWLARRAHR